MIDQRDTRFASFFQAGFECSSHRRRDGVRLDLIRATSHDRHIASDYRQCAELGLRTLREPEAPAYAGLDGAGEPDDALRDRVSALLSPTPVSRDEIVRATGAPAALVFAALMELSLAGRAGLLAGGMVVKE